MTPTLMGRWQTRLLLLGTAGLFITFFFCLRSIGSQPNVVYLWVLGYLTAFGMIWDVVYIYLQRLRWDRDWPNIFQLFAGFWEAGFLILIAKTVHLPGIASDELNFSLFILHYSLVWLAVYTLSHTALRILFPAARFRGGRWL